jgi:uncharacterized coiled-coil DUF342 family protein
VERLRRVLLDRDNFPNMESERRLPVKLAREAADEIERLSAERDELRKKANILDAMWVSAEKERDELLARLKWIASGNETHSECIQIARVVIAKVEGGK